MLCSVVDCQRLVAKGGLCNAHYIKKRLYGDPLISKQRAKGATSRIELKDGYALVELTQGKWAVIDLSDIDEVSKFSWHYISSGYAYSHQVKLLLHQFLIGKAPKGYETDHENRNKLDCRRDNISHVTYFHNNRNSDRVEHSDGCVYDVIRRKWKATFKYNGKIIYSGYFKEKIDAIKASKAARLRLETQEIE
jgi:hypothetical protein